MKKQRYVARLEASVGTEVGENHSKAWPRSIGNTIPGSDQAWHTYTRADVATDILLSVGSCHAHRK
jgi:hypothetical protein